MKPENIVVDCKNVKNGFVKMFLKDDNDNIFCILNVKFSELESYKNFLMNS